MKAYIKAEDVNYLLKEYGFNNQLICCIEEMSELQKEICKIIRTDYIKDSNIIEEYCDVITTLIVLQQIFQINDEDIQNRINEKIKRVRK